LDYLQEFCLFSNPSRGSTEFTPKASETSLYQKGRSCAGVCALNKMIAMMMALKIVIKSIDSFLFVFLHQGKKVSGVIEAKPLFNSVVHYADNHYKLFFGEDSV
jgi:Cu/Ag efflux pump CusA